MTDHTLGPWAENSCEIQAVDGSPICEMLARPEDSGVNYPHRAEADANSRLICAAPDLLAAMMAIQTIATAPINPNMDLKMIAKKAIKAIAKAKGGE